MRSAEREPGGEPLFAKVRERYRPIAFLPAHHARMTSIAEEIHAFDHRHMQEYGVKQRPTLLIGEDINPPLHLAPVDLADLIG
jgi:hypothetical protein